MNFKNFKFGITFVVIALMASSMFFTSCAKDDDIDLTIDLVGLYEGEFASLLATEEYYEVTVSKVDNNTVKITPEDDNGTTFEITILNEGDGTYTCLNCSTVQITFGVSGEDVDLDYSLSSSSEAFNGDKQ